MSTNPQQDLIRSVVLQTIAALPKSDRLAYTIAEAAAAIGLPRSTLRDHVSSGELKASKRCGKWLILREDLIRWISES